MCDKIPYILNAMKELFAADKRHRESAFGASRYERADKVSFSSRASEGFLVRGYGTLRYHGEGLVRVLLRDRIFTVIRVVPRSNFVPEALSASGLFYY